ncbi:MAG: hypothetical protein AAF513_05280 [Pseudomonadota bacterium]
MRLVLKVLGGLVALLLLVVILQFVASESGEVVVLTSTDAGGTPQETRLWVVDLDGQWYLRTGSEASGWYRRLVANPQVTVGRGDGVFAATAVPEPAKRDTINGLMNAKYGWADDFIDLMFGREDAIPILLDRT